MITLVQFPSALGLPNLSPFCMKVETWLRLAGLPYEVEWQPNPRSAPLGKLPVVRDNGRLICDSHSIIDELARAHGKDLDAALSAQQRAVAHAFERMLSEHLYWAIVYFRWADDAGWARMREVFFAPVPAPLRGLIGRLARRSTLAQLKGHGLGRHGADEILRRARQDIDALAALLGAQDYFFGAAPTRLDAAAYAFVANVWEVQDGGPLKALVEPHANLRAWCERMRARCFPVKTS